MLDRFVPPLATGRTPVTPVVRGSPVTLVITPDAGVPSAGVVKVGLVSVLFVRVSVVARPTRVSVEVGRVSVPVLTMLENEGVVSEGLVLRTFEPEPVEVVTPVPPAKTGSTVPHTDIVPNQTDTEPEVEKN
jgi:hypothetical protein